MSFATPVTLRGKHASLVPLALEHATALADAARDGELWKLWYTFVPHADKMTQEIERRYGTGILEKLADEASKTYVATRPAA